MKRLEVGCRVLIVAAANIRKEPSKRGHLEDAWRNGFVGCRAVVTALSNYYGIPVANLTGDDITEAKNKFIATHPNLNITPGPRLFRVPQSILVRIDDPDVQLTDDYQQHLGSPTHV